MGRRKKRKQKRTIFILVIIFICFLFGISCFLFLNDNNNSEQKQVKLDEIMSHYNNYVTTNKEAILYNSDFEEVGKIGSNVELILEEQQITAETRFFKINQFDEYYYIKYGDVEKIDKLTEKNDRYLNYILFNENIKTKKITNFYDEDDKLVYSFNKDFSFPIVIKENEKYGVVYNEQLLYIKEEDVENVIENYNTDKKNSSGVGVLNYHAFYDENDSGERSNCVTEICHSMSQFKSHLDFFKENNILTITMSELEKYIDGKLQLPKSVLITVDDGPKTEHAVDMLKEYKMYATIFLVTSWFDEDSYYRNEYIELHSHTHNMHDGGQCPGGQGGGIKCLSEEVILNDLRQSREELNGSSAFAYPFYEYNEYSIRMLKEAGFTMAFIGESSSSDNLVHVGSDKYRLRRFVIVTYTSMNDLKNYFGQIK